MQILPERGERVLIIGQTGSGKTAFAAWMLKRIPRAPIIIYDTKIEAKFNVLTPNVVVSTMDEAWAEYSEGTSDYIIVRPPAELLGEPEALDDMLWEHYIRFGGVDAYIDEIYSYHTSTGRPFKGLLNILQRGRSRGITCIMSTQRPAFLSKFALTQAQKIYIFFLPFEPDTKRIAEMMPLYKDKPMLVQDEFKFWGIDMNKYTIELFEPVKLDKGLDTGYVDEITVLQPDAERARKLIWS